MLQNFGTALSREQMKHVFGGDEEDYVDGGGVAVCKDARTECTVWIFTTSAKGTCGGTTQGGGPSEAQCKCSGAGISQASSDCNFY